jgi:hypothetical protein
LYTYKRYESTDEVNLTVKNPACYLVAKVRFI